MRSLIFRRDYSYTLSQLDSRDWEYIHLNTGKVINIKDGSQKLDSDTITLENCLRYPGLIVDTEEAKNSLQKYFGTEFPKDLILPRGNLSTYFRFNNIPTIVCGIAPGYSEIDLQAPKWLLGPSSKLLHKILFRIGICPYFTNIYKKSFVGNNTKCVSKDYYLESAKLLTKELKLLLNDVWSDSYRVFFITLGNYNEYKQFLRNLDLKIKERLIYIPVYHPSYFLRQNITNTDHDQIKSEIDKIKIIMGAYDR